MKKQNTKTTKKTAAEKQIERETHVLDATDQALGRIASQIAVFLRGKNKPSYQPHIDDGDYVVVQNAGHLKFTGKKLDHKIYYRNTGYPGGIRETKLKDLANDDPKKLLQMAVRKMLPDNKLRNDMLKRLTIE